MMNQQFDTLAWKILACTVAATALHAATTSAQAAPNSVAGVWIDHTGKGAIKIEPCGAKICGKIVWLRDTKNAEGKPLVDRHNPDAGKQKRPICGLPVIGELAPVGEGSYDGGWIYDPKDGKSYSAAIEVAGPEQLKVTGYLGIKLMGQSFTWKRASGELPSCDVAANEAAAPAAIAKPVAAAAKPTPPPQAAPTPVTEAAIVEQAPTELAPVAKPVAKKVTTSSTEKPAPKPVAAPAIAKPTTSAAKPTAQAPATKVQGTPTKGTLAKTAPVGTAAKAAAKPTTTAKKLDKTTKSAASSKEVLPWTTTTTAVSQPAAKPAPKATTESASNLGAQGVIGTGAAAKAKTSGVKKTAIKKPVKAATAKSGLGAKPSDPAVSNSAKAQAKSITQPRPSEATLY